MVVGKLVVFYKVIISLSKPQIVQNNNDNDHKEMNSNIENHNGYTMNENEMVLDHIVYRRFSQFLKIHGMLGF